MNTLLRGEVDQLRRPAYTAKRGFGHGQRRAGNRYDGAIVVRIARPVEQVDTLDPHRGDDREDLAFIHPLGEIRHTLDDRCFRRSCACVLHGRCVTSTSYSPTRTARSRSHRDYDRQGWRWKYARRWLRKKSTAWV